MTADQQSAMTALKSVESIAGRLDRSRDGEDRAADILELWHGTETSLRALMGGSSLSGQGLIRELRQRELISLGQAYALLEFLGARDRANRTTYRATDNDVVVAREGFRQLESGLLTAVSEPSAPPLPPRPEVRDTPAVVAAPSAAAAAEVAGADRQGPTIPQSPATMPPPPPPSYNRPAPYSQPGARSQTPAEVVTPAADTTYRSSGRRKMPANIWLIAALAAIVLTSLGGFAYYFSGRTNPDQNLTDAIETMQSGKREAAKGQFATIARDNPALASPHVFLSRLAREEGDLGTARRELDVAIRLEPNNAIALREMGLILFSAGDYDLSRKFFIRALQNNPSDKASQGYLGCALARMNRFDEARGFLSRAGPGSWTSCLPQRTQ
ncbi:MAG: tetratricopeptide repeat protein [Gemmatimonadaceae bacterium]